MLVRSVQQKPGNTSCLVLEIRVAHSISPWRMILTPHLRRVPEALLANQPGPKASKAFLTEQVVLLS